MSAGAWDAVQKHGGMILNVEQNHPTLGGRNLYILGEAVGGTGRASVEALTQVHFSDWKKDDILRIEQLG